MKMSELHAEREITPDYLDDVVDRRTRDQFAMAALTALLQHPDYKNAPCEAIARASFIYANEMMAAREIKR